MNVLTQNKLKELLYYNEQFGIFTRKKKRTGSALAGTIAGTLHPCGYVYIKVMGEKYLSHRLAFLYINGSLPPHEVDHINGDRADNRWSNLRCVTRAENQKNKKSYKNNKSGVMGVNWNRTHDKWAVYLSINKKSKQLYWGDDFFEACCIRASAEIDHNYHANHGRKI